MIPRLHIHFALRIYLRIDQQDFAFHREARILAGGEARAFRCRWTIEGEPAARAWCVADEPQNLLFFPTTETHGRPHDR
jgi:hypothetical protein